MELTYPGSLSTLGMVNEGEMTANLFKPRPAKRGA